MQFQISNIKFQVLQFIFLLLIFSLPLFVVDSVLAQGEKDASAAVESREATSSNADATENAAKKSEYQLPYPGLLPDHPLYILKTIRDRIIDILIADPLKKADFTLLQADKRLASGIVLVDKGNPELAEVTVSKGEDYLARSVALRQRAKKEGKDVLGITTKLTAALDKHQEVLSTLAEKTSDRVQERFTEMAASIEKHKQSVKNE